MNREVELHDSDESDSDFCPEKEAGNEVSEEEASSEISSGSEEEGQIEKKEQHKRSTKTNTSTKKLPAKKLKSKKRVRAQDEVRSTDTDDECEPVETKSRRNTRQSDDTKRLGSGREKDNLESDEEDKSRSDALWADFLSDVKPKAADKATATATTENGHSSPKCLNKNYSASTTSKANPTEKKSEEKIKVTEILDFAGEEVRLEKVVSADSVKENNATLQPKTSGTSTSRAKGGGVFPMGLKRPMAGGSGSGGLGSILNQIGKKKKISVLEKSQLDWKSFKQDEGIEEELQTFNKGKDGYLERQDFLQRTDVRQFEIEKSLRQSKRLN